MTSRLPKYLTQDELKRFFDALPSPRDRARFALIYHYGLRVDEATMLTLEDLDLKNHRIKIRRLKNGLGVRSPSGDILRSCFSRTSAFAGTPAPTCSSPGGTAEEAPDPESFREVRRGRRHQGSPDPLPPSLDRRASPRRGPRHRVRG